MAENDKKLFLLDAFALIYRAYFAFSNNHRVNSKGLNTSAMLGFTNTLVEVLKKEKPTHIAVVFDTAAATVRHEEYSDYKANREEMPEDLATSIPYIVKIIEGFNIPVISYDGYEADDIIGTLSRKASSKGFKTYMMTPDKDYGQLVSDNVFIYKPAQFGKPAEVMGVAEVCQRWNIEGVHQVIDILGLMGDKVDNIPGIPGVGEKTAMQLVKDYGSVENLLVNTSKLKGKLKEKVEQNKEKAIFSKKLATIICDVPVELEEEKLKITGPNKEALKALFMELEFRSLAKNVLGEDLKADIEVSVVKEKTKAKASNGTGDLFAVEVEKTAVVTAVDSPEEETTLVEVEETIDVERKNHDTIKTIPHNYVIADSKEKRAALIAELSTQKFFCFDTETTGIDAHNVELVGMSFALKPRHAWYVPVPENQEETRAIVNEFKVLFENPNIEKVGQNIKYDMSVLKWYGIEIQGKMFDTMVAHFLIQPEMRHNMDVLAETYLNYSPVSIETLIGKRGKAQLSMRQVPLQDIAEYAAEDADITLQLKAPFEKMLAEKNARKLFDEVEIPLVPVLSAMEFEGINLDKETLSTFSKELETEILKTEKEIQDLAGINFNVSSPKQVGEVLFEHLKIVEKPKKTKTGQYATSEDVLSKLVKFPIVGKILDYRELQKLKSTYVDSLPLLVNPKTGRIHTSYNQVVAVTGRLSSDNPNLQNIPIRTEKGREVRKAFVPRNQDYTLLSADYSQIELRIIAVLSKDEGMMEAFRSGQDIHTATASKVYGVDVDKVTSDMRRNAKMVNFGIIYGISAFGLSERLNIPRKEAAGIIEQYFLKYPGIKTYMNDSIDLAREKGYVETLMGRRRYLRDINSSNAVVRGFAERNAINAPIQGTAADMIKIAMINIQNDFTARKFKSKMLLQVHDELVFDIYKPELETVKPIIEERMKHALDLAIPIEVGMGTGDNWLKAH